MCGVFLLNTVITASQIPHAHLTFVPSSHLGFNILGPATRQLDAMKEKQKKGMAGAVGLGAAGSMLLAGSADAAEVMQLAAGDSRLGILSVVVLIALGWVGERVCCIGCLVPQHADVRRKYLLTPPASKLMRIASPSPAHPGFNILGPATRQLDAMKSKQK